jgi:DNA topoisomerase-1
MGEDIIAYCVKCKERRPMENAEPIYLPGNRPATRGRCPVCGSTLIKMGRAPAHDRLPDPPKDEYKLVIVESPAKARTVGKFLGKGYLVKASIGHVRDLLRSSLSVDVSNDFKPYYVVPKEKREVVKELQEAVPRRL